MKKIDVEAHFYTREFQEYMLARKETPREEFYKGFIRLWYEPNVWEPLPERLLGYLGWCHGTTLAAKTRSTTNLITERPAF